MKRTLVVSSLILASLAASLSVSCVGLKEAQLGGAEVVQARVVERISTRDGGDVEVRCGVGEVCAEVKLIHVQRSPHGPVALTLQNRTEEDIAVQVALESFDGDERRTDRSTFHDVILAPRGEQVLELVTAAATDDLLVVHLRARS